MTRLLACFAIAGALWGGACTSTHHVARPVSVGELAARTEVAAAEGRSVAIVYPAIRPRGGAEPVRIITDLTLESPIAHYTADAVYVATPGEPTKLSLSEVRGYEVTRRGRGALEGVLIGTAVGVLAGVLRGVADGSDPDPIPKCTNLDGGMICTTGGGTNLSAGEKAAITGVALGVTGAGIGLLFGLLVGHTDRFEF